VERRAASRQANDQPAMVVQDLLHEYDHVLERRNDTLIDAQLARYAAWA
jgi:hypothetical protein